MVEAHDVGGIEVCHQDSVVGVRQREVKLDVEGEDVAPPPLAGKLKTWKFDKGKQRVTDLTIGTAVVTLKGKHSLKDDRVGGVGGLVRRFKAAQPGGGARRLVRMIAEEVVQQDIGV